MAVPTPKPVYAWETAPTPIPTVVPLPAPSESDAERWAARDVWRSTYDSACVNEAAPLSAEWFQHLETKRYRRQGRWLPVKLEFDLHAGESLIAVGDGLGLDWVKYAEAGARVTVVDPAADRVRLQRQQFSLRGVEGTATQAPFDHLPLDNDGVDVACAMFHERPAAWPGLVSELFRVLRPGGKVIAVVPASFNPDRILDVHRPWRYWLRRGQPSRPANFPASELKATFQPFYDVRISRRHLRRSELPYLWRWIALPLAERVIGRFSIVKAFKPLLAKPATRMAA